MSDTEPGMAEQQAKSDALANDIYKVIATKMEGVVADKTINIDHSSMALVIACSVALRNIIAGTEVQGKFMQSVAMRNVIGRTLAGANDVLPSKEEVSADGE